MPLKIRKNESLRSYVERNLFVPNSGLENEKFQGLARSNWDSSQVKLIAEFLGWHGCRGFNKLLHRHTKYPWQSLLKSRFNHSYSDHEYISERTIFDSVSALRSYCPVCAMEDKLKLGYSYWRRVLPEVKVCAKHNVILLTECQFCDKPFAGSGHAGSVMWSGCSGRQLGEAQPVGNLDPAALRLAQFCDEFCQAENHIFIDTAAAVLETKLAEKAVSSLTAPLDDITVEEFKRYIESHEISDVRQSWVYHSLSSDLAELAASLYKTFLEFSADCQKLESNTPVIDFFWDTYCCFGQCTEHFVRENYHLGVAEWSWPAFEGLSQDPFLRELSVLMWTTGKYRCCIPPGTPSSTDNPIYAPHPGVPRLAQDESLAIGSNLS